MHRAQIAALAADLVNRLSLEGREQFVGQCRRLPDYEYSNLSNAID